MNQDLSALPALKPATRVRYVVLGFTCTLAMVTYLDRACFAMAVSHMLVELRLQSVAELTWALTAFNIAYAVFEVPTGWLGDVFGPRKVLIRIVLWWSFFTALTTIIGLPVGGGWYIGLNALVVIRFLFGMGEAGAFPNITRALHNWFPLAERGIAQGAVWFSGRLMGGLTPMIWVLLVEKLELTWRHAFWIFGGIGVLWCIGFASWFRNRPEERPEVNEAERALIHQGRHDEGAAHAHVPWLKLLRNWNLWALCFMYFCASYGWYFNLSYYPDFLVKQYGVDKTSWVSAIYMGGPLTLGALGCLLGGWFTERMIRKTGNRKWGRRFPGFCGHALCAVSYLGCLVAPNAFFFALSVSLAAFFNDLTMGPAWATCQDIGRRHAAIVAGCMNTIGNLGGAAGTWVTGTVLGMALASYAAANGISPAALTGEQRSAGEYVGYQINFVSFAVVYAIAALLWLRIDATKPVLPEDAQA
jgi:MFS family permease